jgi:ParB family chromosome partitioning protein
MASKSNATNEEFPLDDIQVGENIRSDLPNIDELAASIASEGFLQPIIVTRAEGGKVDLVAGWRRYAAAKKLKLRVVPVRILTADKPGRLRIALLENLQREDMNPLDKAKAIQKLMEMDDLDQKTAAEFLNVSESYVSQHLKLLKLPGAAQSALKKGQIDMAGARALGRLPDEAAVKEFLPVAKTATVAELNTQIEFKLHEDKKDAEREALAPPKSRSKKVDAEPAPAAEPERKSLAERYADLEMTPLNKSTLREKLMEHAIKLDQAKSAEKRAEYKFILRGLEIAAGITK